MFEKFELRADVIDVDQGLSEIEGSKVGHGQPYHDRKRIKGSRNRCCCVQRQRQSRRADFVHSVAHLSSHSRLPTALGNFCLVVENGGPAEFKPWRNRVT